MPRYIVFHKPFGVLSKFSDREGRLTLAKYIPVPDVYPAGRLDMKSEGLLLLSDDRRILHRVTDPRWKLPKTYLVLVEGVPDDEALRRLRSGVVIKGYRTAPAKAEILPVSPEVPPRPARGVRPNDLVAPYPARR